MYKDIAEDAETIKQYLKHSKDLKVKDSMFLLKKLIRLH